MLEAGFPVSSFVVDPEGCGCTDCIIGASTPMDELTTEDIIFAMWAGYNLIDRTGP
jgi:hypothetical protein